MEGKICNFNICDFIEDLNVCFLRAREGTGKERFVIS